MSFKKVFSTLTSLAISLSFFIGASPAEANFRSTYGTDFWVHFDANMVGDTENFPALFLASAQDGTATVTWPSGNSEQVDLTGGTVATVDAVAEILTDYHFADADNTVQQVAVHVETDVPINLYLSNRARATSDASIAYPTAYLGTRYRIANVPDAIPSDGSSYVDGQPVDWAPELFSITAVESGATSVTVTLAANAVHATLASGATTTVELQQGETFTLSGDNLGGSLVESDKRVQVSGSNECVRIERGACDHSTEFMTPVETWGKSFFLASSRNSVIWDRFYVFADEDGTELTFSADGRTDVTATIDAGEYYIFKDETQEAETAPVFQLTSSQPVSVLQVLDGGSYTTLGDNPTTKSGDPASILIPPTLQFLNDAIFTTPASGFDVNYITLIAKSSDVQAGEVQLDGTPIPSDSFTAIGATGFSVATLDIAVGSHRVSSTNGFAIYVTGFGVNDSYGYAGGSGLVDLIQNPGGVPGVGYQSVEEITDDGPSSGDVSRDVERTIAAPYPGPVVYGSPSSTNAPGSKASLPGKNLSQIEKVVIDGKEVDFTISDGELVLELPESIKPGTYDVIVSGPFGSLVVQQGITIQGSAAITSGAWTKINEAKDSVRVFYKDPVGVGKVQFFHNGQEIAWVRALDEADPKLSKAMVGGVEVSYLVRTVELMPDVKNVFEIYVDGQRVWRAAYAG